MVAIKPTKTHQKRLIASDGEGLMHFYNACYVASYRASIGDPTAVT